MASTTAPIYPGSASFFIGDTPFGYYDEDPRFQCEVEEFSNWAAKRLGYPIMDVELQDKNFYAAYEDAVNEYGSQVATYAARDNILRLMGIDTGSLNLSTQYIPPTMRGIFKLAKEFGTEVGSGGTLTWFTGSIQVVANKQVYNLLTDTTIETGSFSTDQFTIRRVFHEDTPAYSNYQGALGTSLGLSNEFGFGLSAMSSDYLSMPLYEDVLRAQAVELNDQIRRSSYSFQITNNRIRIFPIPSDSFKIWFNYTLDDENVSSTASDGKVTNYSNVPYGLLAYGYINQMGKQWIKKYALAIAKEMLGYVRGKYQSIVVPGESTSLNSADLISAAEREMESCLSELKEILDQLSRQSQLERSSTESDMLSKHLSKVPLKIYVG